MSDKTVFISYRRDAVGKSFSRSLKTSLEHQGYDVFLDVDCIDAGAWANQILTKVPRRAHFLLLLTPGALDRCADAGDWVRREFELAQTSGRNIVPVREESIDLAEMAKSCPASMRAVFDLQIADLRHGSFQADVTALTQRYIVPNKAPLVTPTNPLAPTPTSKFDISHFDVHKYAPAELIGREAETKLLNDAWMKVSRAESPRPHILTFVALGGEGKTSLVAKWAAELAHQDWPGCDAVFAWSFYSQGTRDQAAASSDTFLKDALTFFGDAAMASSAQGAFDKGRRLSQLVGERRALLILDGVEPLQYAPTSPTPGELADQGLAALLKGLAAASHGLCVVTTRYAISDLRAFLGKSVREEKLTRLSKEAGVALLQKLGVKGNQAEFEKLVEDVKGHALTLNLLGTYLRDAHTGDIRRRDLVKIEEADAEEQGGHAFRVMDAYVKWLEFPQARSSGRESAQTSAPGNQSQLTSAATEEEMRSRRALALLRLLGLFDRPATADCLNALWKGEAIAGLTEPLIGISEAQRNMALTRLESAKLLTIHRDAAGTLLSLDAHPLLREYFAVRLKWGSAGVPPAAVGVAPTTSNALTSSPAGSQRDETNRRDAGLSTRDARVPQETWRAAHRRLYEHLCATTKEGDQPTLEDLQPLYQAVAHGCQAGLLQEACNKVYFARIQRGNEAYSARKLGAFGSDLGAIACFFEPPWSRVSPALTEAAQAWLLNEAAFRLCSLGRLTEALEPMRAGLLMSVNQEDWANAAQDASNLSELELTLGEVAGAVGDAEQSVTYAHRSGDFHMRQESRCTSADVLHQAGRRSEAQTRFREAEELHAKGQPQTPLLYSIRGFWYCDLLLTEAERAAWQTILGRAELPLGPNIGAAQQRSPTLLESCRAVEQRAAQTLKWAEEDNRSLLDIALDHLTLGRAALYRAILESGSGVPPLNLDAKQRRDAVATLNAAVNGLRRSGNMDHLPRGLLTRAWQRSLTGARTGPENAQSDLDEAWEIAERGPMPLFLADIHLYRARLFGVVSNQLSVISGEKYPWESPQADLEAAEQLIHKHGYHRRDQELADAKVLLQFRVG